MNIQDQLNDLSERLNRIEEKLATNHNSVADAIRQTEPDYTHLLPEGYEFCAEEQAEKWVKVEYNSNEKGQNEIGFITRRPISDYKPFYRPIRKIKYHVAVHEVVTIEPDPYTIEKHGDGWAIYKGRDLMHHGYNLGQIHDEKLAQYIGGLLKGFKDTQPDPYQPDWSNAPEGTVAHAYDLSGLGYWYTRNTLVNVWIGNCIESPHCLPSGLDWKQSLRVNPKLK
jgi:hypothetical protein